MVKHCTGIVCCPMDEAFCDRLKLPLMVEQNEEYFGTKFCVTVDGGPAMGARLKCTTLRTALRVKPCTTDCLTPTTQGLLLGYRPTTVP